MDTAFDRLEKYIADAREIIEKVVGIDFEDEVWQLPHNRAHLKYGKRFDWKGIPPSLAKLGKTIVANESIPNNYKGRFGGKSFIIYLRNLGKILGERDVTSLTRKDFDLTSRDLAERNPQLKATTLANYGGGLKGIVNICNLRRLTEARIEWSNPFPTPDKGEREHLIPPEVFKAFGEIRSTVLATDNNDPDRLLVHAITILICTGMRIGELLTLPADCWHEGQGEDDEGRVLKGYWLGYTPEKRGLTEDTFPRWVPTVLVPIVKESIEEILRITGPARENARALAEGVVNLHIDLDQSYTLPEATALLGYSGHDTFRIRMGKLGLGTWKSSSSKHRATGIQLADYVRRLSDLNPVMTDPFRLDLHDALLVVPNNFFNRRYPFPVVGTARLMTPGQVQSALKSDGPRASLFERFKKFDPKTGKPYSFATHDPRHTLTTWQIKHGFDHYEVAAYFGRGVQRPEWSNAHYIDMTQEQYMVLVDRALETGRFQGGWADAIAKIKDPVRKEEVRHLLAGNVGFSQLGICAHPEGTSPPTMPEACSRCPGLIVIPGSPGHQKRALEIQADIEQRVAVYEAQVAEGVFMAGKWMELEYERQAKHRRVVEVLFSKDTLEPGEEPTLVQMGNAKTKEC